LVFGGACLFWDIFFSTIGGLGLFLFGIQIMASGMQKAAGDRFRKILEILTNKPVMGVLTGILVTLLVQSSSTVSVMVVGFANAGLMNLSQAISVIIGTNIGTTVTAQIVSFKIGVIIYPAILPVVLVAEHYSIHGDKLIKAVTFSHLLNIYIKQYTGKLSAVCGCAISAGAGAAAAVTWMLNGSDDQISGAVKNIIGNLFGMICDGAKASCSFKLSTASSEAIIAAMLALNDIVISGRDGIIFETAEDTITHMGEICVKGMRAADQTILDIMMRKDYRLN